VLVKRRFSSTSVESEVEDQFKDFNQFWTLLEEHKGQQQTIQ
jgi:hypothetical protein